MLEGQWYETVFEEFKKVCEDILRGTFDRWKEIGREVAVCYLHEHKDVGIEVGKHRLKIGVHGLGSREITVPKDIAFWVRGSIRSVGGKPEHGGGHTISVVGRFNEIQLKAEEIWDFLDVETK